MFSSLFDIFCQSFRRTTKNSNDTASVSNIRAIRIDYLLKNKLYSCCSVKLFLAGTRFWLQFHPLSKQDFSFGIQMLQHPCCLCWYLELIDQKQKKKMGTTFRGLIKISTTTQTQSNSYRKKRAKKDLCSSLIPKHKQIHRKWNLNSPDSFNTFRTTKSSCQRLNFPVISPRPVFRQAFQPSWRFSKSFPHSLHTRSSSTFIFQEQTWPTNTKSKTKHLKRYYSHTCINNKNHKP